jgi:hypothetical protein
MFYSNLQLALNTKTTKKANFIGNILLIIIIYDYFPVKMFGSFSSGVKAKYF